MKSPLTTLCYLEKDGKYLMLHRVKKKQDVNEGKWIGVGGHFEEGESPEDCLLREVREETGLTLTSWRFRGLITFESEGWPMEYICVYTADGFEGELTPCSEGELAWVKKSELLSLHLWEGDRFFLRLLMEDAPFFSLKMKYRGIHWSARCWTESRWSLRIPAAAAKPGPGRRCLTGGVPACGTGQNWKRRRKRTYEAYSRARPSAAASDCSDLGGGVCRAECRHGLCRPFYV